MAGVIKFAEKKVVSTNSSAWYDHTFWEVPFTGEFNLSEVCKALRKRVNSTFNTLGEIEVVREGVIKYEVMHSIGD